jgi:AraC family transcriptional regulator, positive regulator of tynA and feaB
MMEQLFSTETVHSRDRFDYWHNVACRNLLTHDSRPECRLKFQAAIYAGCLADVGLVLFSNSPMGVSRTPRQIAQAISDELFVCRQMSGLLALEQNGRETATEAGDVTLIDPLIPYRGKFSRDSNVLVLRVPRRALEARVGGTREMVLRSIKPSQAASSLLSSFAAMLPPHVGRMSPVVENLAKEHVLDLLAVSLTTAMGTRTPRISSAHSFALMNVRAAIEARLTDPMLDASAVAAAAGISVRYANSVLAREDTSIMRLILARRLARCQEALRDPSQAHRTLSEIAYGWGFSDMTHFSRRFRAAYGVLPSEYRSLTHPFARATRQ